MQATAFPPQSISFSSYAINFIQNAPYREQKNGKSGLSANTLRNYQNFFTIWLKFEQQFEETLFFNELDQNKITLFKQWLLEDRNYSINNVGRILSALKTICLDAQKYNGKIKRKETGIFPKYTIIASHDLRRSFATNFYSKIPTPLLMSMTDHSRETTFLKYIGLEENRDSYANDFMRNVSLLEL